LLCGGWPICERIEVLAQMYLHAIHKEAAAAKLDFLPGFQGYIGSSV
jgi:hypothetical protein